MLFFFHHYELPVILSHQADPEEDLLADPIAALTDEVNIPAIDELVNHPLPDNIPQPDLPHNDCKLTFIFLLTMKCKLCNIIIHLGCCVI